MAVGQGHFLLACGAGYVVPPPLLSTAGPWIDMVMKARPEELLRLWIDRARLMHGYRAGICKEFAGQYHAKGFRKINKIDGKLFITVAIF